MEQVGQPMFYISFLDAYNGSLKEKDWINLNNSLNPPALQVAAEKSYRFTVLTFITKPKFHLQLTDKSCENKCIIFSSLFFFFYWISDLISDLDIVEALNVAKKGYNLHNFIISVHACIRYSHTYTLGLFCEASL